jgi:uncharacterized LabA/DUF88 family protein
VPRFYLRRLREELASGEHNGAGPVALFVRPFPLDFAPAIPSVPAGAADPAVAIAVDAIMTPAVADITGVDDELGAESGDVETAGAPVRRRRRGRRGRGRGESEAAVAEEHGILPGEPALPPQTVDYADENYVPDVPPSSHLAAMVESGGLLLPDPRNRRRRRRGGRGRGDGLTPGEEDAPEEPVAMTPSAPPLPRGGRERMGPLEELIARQNVVFDSLVQRQTAMLKTLERMMMVLERGGGRGGGGGNFTMLPRVAVFVDVPNIVYAAERIGVDIDWNKVLNFITHDRQLVRATAYAPVSDDPSHRVELQKFVHPFYSLPYRILTKPLKRFGNGEIKANFDVELAIDVVTMADRLDIVTLVSGDGDFRRMVEMVQSKGVRVEVMAFSSSTAGELRAVCDDYIDFSQHLQELTITR